MEPNPNDEHPKPPSPRPEQQSAPDPYDPMRYRLTQDFGTTVGVKKVLTAIPVGKPNRHEFVRVKEGDDWRLETFILEDKALRESYLVDPSLWSELGNDLAPVCLLLATTRQGDPLIWQVKLPGPDGRSNSWNDSALAAATLAEKSWIKVSANLRAGMYDVFTAAGNLGQPVWPDLPFNEVLRLAFKDRVIQAADHPLLRALRGEV